MEIAILLTLRKPAKKKGILIKDLSRKPVDSHLSGPIDAEFKATADDMETETSEPVEHAWKVEVSHLSWVNSLVF